MRGLEISKFFPEWWKENTLWSQTYCGSATYLPTVWHNLFSDCATHNDCESIYASVSSSGEQKFYLHQLRLDLAVNHGFQKMLILPIMENSSGRQPKICEVALTNRTVRGQVSSVLMAFISVTSSLKMAARIPATTSVFQLQPYVYIPRAKEKKGMVQRHFQKTGLWELCLCLECHHMVIPSWEGNEGCKYSFLGDNCVSS